MIEIPLIDIGKSIVEEKETSKLKYRYNPSILESFYFGWIFPIINYARKHTMSLDALENLSKDQKSETVYHRWHDYWNQQKNSNSKDPLLQSIKSTFKGQFILGFIFCFLSYTSTMVIPIILYFFAQYLAQPNISRSAGWDVFYLILIPLFRFTRSLFNGHSIFKLEMIGAQISHSLSIGMVNKAMKYSVLCNKSFKLGQISGLMQVDCFRLSMFPRSLTELIVYCYCLLFGIVFLAILLNYSVLAGLGVSIAIVFSNIQIAKKTRICLKQFSKATDQRMKVTNQVFNNIKFIKVNAYQQTFYDRLMQKRQIEINCLKKKKKFDAVSTYIMWLTPKLILAVTFILYVYTGHPLSPPVTFSILSLYGYLQFYLQNLPNAINNTMQSFNALTRVQNFLLAEQINTSCITYNNLNVPSRDKSNSNAITMENGSFYWDKQNQKNDGINPLMNLVDLNFNIRQGEMVAIIGGVGAGKSSLIYSLLGQMKFKESQRPRVTVNGSLSLVTQKPWIINDTVRNNITFGQRFDPAKYKEIVKYACLERDFELFTHGDQTMIGEKGATLSGGQKARISFARSLYSNTDILFLDDLLSAVDVHVGKFMMTETLLKFCKNKTRILVTHALYYLKYCDKVLMMQGGKIVEQGPFDVIKSSSRFQDMQDAMMKDEKTKRATTIKLPPVIVTQNQEQNEQEQRQQQILRQANNVRNERNPSAIDRSKLESIVQRKSKMSALHKMKIQVKEADTKRQSKKEIIEVKIQTKKAQSNQNELMVAEQISDSSVFKLYHSYIKYNSGWLYFSVLVINQLAWMVCNSVNNIWLTFWTAFYTQADPQVSQDFYSVGFVLTGLVYALLATFRILMIYTSAPKMSMYIHQSMISNLLFSSLNEFFDRVPLGRILNRLSKDLNSVDMNVPMFVNNSLAFIFFLGSNSITMNLQSTYYIFIPLLVVFFALNHVLRMFYAKPATQLSKLESITKSPIVSCFSQILSGLSTIRSYKKQSMFLMKNCLKIDDNKRTTKDKKALDVWFILRMTVLSFITTFGAIAYALFWPLDSDDPQALVQRASNSTLLVVTSVGLDQFTYFFINNLGNLDTELQSIERCETFMDLEPEEGYVEYLKDRPVNKVKSIQKRLLSDGWPDRGRIDFLNLKCRYRKNLDLVLKGLNFTIAGGHKIGVVGRTGSGKSTIMLCLLRILQAAQGQILIDGRDIGKLSLDELRSKITIILQDPCLFAGTVRQNLDPLQEFTDQQLNNALHLCGLKQTLDANNALDTAVTQNGQNFSAGERQLFSICRATLKPSKIVLIDEATANIDVQTEAIIYKAMNEGFKHSTVITIAHRLNTVINSDRILVLQGGLLKQYDNPQQLLKNPESFFAQLYNQSLKENKM